MENKNPVYAVGFICGILSVFAIAFIMRIIIVKYLKKKEKCGSYDERQIDVRRKAASVGFVVLSVWQIFMMCMELAFGTLFMTPALWNFCGLLIGVSVFAIICIWKDAYFSAFGKKIKFFAFTIIIAKLNVFFFFRNKNTENILTDNGLLETPFINLFAAIMLYVIAVNFFVKILIDKKTYKEQ